MMNEAHSDQGGVDVQAGQSGKCNKQERIAVVKNLQNKFIGRDKCC